MEELRGAQFTKRERPRYRGVPRPFVLGAARVQARCVKRPQGVEASADALRGARHRRGGGGGKDAWRVSEPWRRVRVAFPRRCPGRGGGCGNDAYGVSTGWKGERRRCVEQVGGVCDARAGLVKP